MLYIIFKRLTSVQGWSANGEVRMQEQNKPPRVM